MRCRISSINSRLKHAFQCVRGNCHEFPASCYAFHQTANARIPLKQKIDQKNTKRHQIDAAFRDYPELGRVTQFHRPFLSGFSPCKDALLDGIDD